MGANDEIPSEVVNVPGKSEYQLYLADIVPVGELEHWWTWSESRYIRYGGKRTSRCSKWRNKQAGENRKLTRGRRTTSYSTVQLNPPVSNHVTKELLLSGQPMQRDYHYLAYYLAGLGLLSITPENTSERCGGDGRSTWPELKASWDS